ncbi:MAG: SpoIIIAH-like family protein [Clostridia bacterium]|nr:SpoIIIAH-like family protein [Clostridia bacterium]
MKNGKRHLILAGLVLALGTAVYLNWQFAPSESFIAPTRNNVSRTDLGKAEYVSAELDSETLARQNSSLAESRLNRQTARDKVLDELEKQLKDTSSDSAARAQALESRTQHIKTIQLENTAETLIKAKGFSDCLVLINGDKVSVLIPENDALTSEKVSVITEIITSQTGADISNIIVTPVK